jgi:putative endonuclease
MYYVYLLKSNRSDFIYVGSTPNLKERLIKHQKGLVRSTRPYLPINLIYSEIYKSKRDAVQREYQLKRYGKALGQLKRRIRYSLGNSEKVRGKSLPTKF